MYKGIYIALSGSVLKQDQLDTLSHNVANASTIGFKKDRASFREFLISGISGIPDSDEGRTMTDLSEVRTDFEAGNQFTTGNPLDVAIVGKGFFCLEGGRFTRKGDLQVGQGGFLVTQKGRKVLGVSGPIQVPEGKIEIAPSGEVRVGGNVVGTIRIADFRDTASLVELSDGEYTSAEAPVPADASVASGHLESSNVEVIKEMVQMITTLREFEIYQKVIRAFDDAASKVNNEMARL